MKIKYVDGFEVRRTVMPDFYVSGSLGEYGCDLIPKDELWIEKICKEETADILKYVRLYGQLMKKMSFWKARKQVNGFLLQKRGNNKVVISNASNHVKKWVREVQKTAQAYQLLDKRLVSSLKTNFVDGIVIRRTLDSQFVSGGHPLIYDYIPSNEIWIDAKQDGREHKYTFFHELYEYQLMRKGVDYDSAHDFTIALEKYLKRRDGVANYRFDAEENKRQR